MPWDVAEAEAAATVFAALLVAATEVDVGAADEETEVCMALEEDVEFDAPPGAAAPVSRPSP